MFPNFNYSNHYKKLDHWIMQFKTFYWLSDYGISANIPYSPNKIMVSVHVSLNLNFPSRNIMAASENRFAPQLNEKEVIELLENAS